MDAEGCATALKEWATVLEAMGKVPGTLGTGISEMKKRLAVIAYGWPYVPLARDGAGGTEKAKRL